VSPSRFSRSRLICIATAGLAAMLCWSCHHSTPPQPPDNSSTTSHNITWSFYRIGDALTNILYDVAVVNDTLAYAVGNITYNDSTGQPVYPGYGLVQWNGKTWTPRRLSWVDTDGHLNPFDNIEGIFVLAPNDIWLVVGSLFHWDGVSPTAQLLWLRTSIPDRSAFLIKIWGSSPSSIYGVGFGGIIVHYDGNTPQVINSGTHYDIRDIWGAVDPTTGRTQIIAVASSADTAKKLISIDGTTVSFLPDSGLSSALYSTWFVPHQKYYVVGAGIGQKNNLDSSPWSVYAPGIVTSYISSRVRGTAINDVFVAGSFKELVHFNGETWYNYRDQVPNGFGALGGLAATKHLVIAVGLEGQPAIAVVGKR
jgi:hypothetical protein